MSITIPGSPLDGPNVRIRSSALAAAGRTIVSVAFQISPAEANSWTTFATITQAPYQGILDTTNTSYVPQNGPYDLRAVATDSTGAVGVSVVSDAVVANDATYIALQPTGTPVNGTIQLTATPDPGGQAPDSVSFQASPAGASSWRTVGTATAQLDSSGNPTGEYVTSFDTTTLADGAYDLQVTGEDASGDSFVGALVRNVTIDNTPPTVSLTPPASSLTGLVTLRASAADSGSGIASVRFETAPAGTDQWTTLGLATSAPYTASVDTAQLSNGSYQLRAEADDLAGNVTYSSVADVSVTNSGVTDYSNLTITNYRAPATGVQLLGEIAGSPDHETWGYGFTTAPPPEVGGAPLPYTAEGSNQLVLLEYTDATGWQIQDVLRNSDGSAYRLYPDATVSVAGAMGASGEGWMIVSQHPAGMPLQLGVFHRSPGGAFELDSGATSTLAPMLGGAGAASADIQLGQSGGSTFGVITTPNQPSSQIRVAVPGSSVLVNAQLQFATLAAGTWTVQSAPVPPSLSPPTSGSSLSVTTASEGAPGIGWVALTESGAHTPLLLGQFNNGSWRWPATGLDALELTGQFAPTSAASISANRPLTVIPVALEADSTGVWIQATITKGSGTTGSVIARYDDTAGQVTQSWCGSLPRTSFDCTAPLDLNHPATLPSASFNTAAGVVADGESSSADALDVYAHGGWEAVPASGYQGSPGASGQAVFADPEDGWLVGANSLGLVSSSSPSSQLVEWPEGNRNPLLSVAAPPGTSTTASSGPLAVGLNGTALHYQAGAGWVADATPPQTHHIGLYGVAFNSPTTAFAVGVAGTILHWDGNAWSEDPQSVSVTTATLNAVAFAPDGQGWAVGGQGTIIHYDGTSWSPEQIDPADAGKNITSVTVAGGDVFAIAGGDLIMRSPDGTWGPVPDSDLPSPAPAAGSLELVSGLPDGGLAVAGRSLLMTRQSSGDPLTYAAQSFEGIPVALSAFRASDGSVRAFVSVAPPVDSEFGASDNIGGFPSGDGDLLLQTAGGWDDLSHDQDPSESFAAPGDGVVQPDPVLAVASSADGSHAWAVGGYSGTHSAAGVGTDAILAARPPGWLASAIWRYDASGSVAPTGESATPVDLPASPGTVSFAFFSSALCKVQCAAAQDAQPSVNLRYAAKQIASFAAQPGGPAFAMMGGNSVGPSDEASYQAGNGETDLRRLPGLLSGLGSLPTYAAYGPLDAVPTSSDPALPWASAFSNAPAPFGPGAAPSDVTPRGAGDSTGAVHKYYAFDVSQNDGKLRVIVLDNSAGSLESSAPGQTAWLNAQLATASSQGLPIVVFASRPLNAADPGAASDGNAVATTLANAGVLAVFTTSGGEGASWAVQSDQISEVPINADTTDGQPQIPEYEGATLTYQQPQNNGVLWYEVSVNTSGPSINVQGIPLISNLALDPVDGLTTPRSQTLQFQAVGRRPTASIATTPADPSFPGFDQYVSIPSPSCSDCVQPSYTFTSSNPVVGDFVVPSGSGSPYPKLGTDGRTTPSSTSGLFCGYNSGTTTVSVTSGLLTASLPVTVQAGGFGPPCGTVPGQTTSVITVPGKVVTKEPGGAVAPPPALSPSLGVLPKLQLPPPPVIAPVRPKPAPPHHPVPAPPAPAPFIASPSASLNSPTIVPPLVPPAVTPVPPGGATVSAQASAKREEKARKHASQSAYSTRPAGTSASDYFYPAVGVIGVLALLLIGVGARPRPRRALALAEVRVVRERRTRYR